MFFVVRGHDPSTVAATFNKNINVRFEVFKCFFEDCTPPPDPNTVPPEEERPSDAVLWSDKETWSDAEEGWGGYQGEGLYDLPVDGDSVKIPKGRLASLGTLFDSKMFISWERKLHLHIIYFSQFI